MGYSLWGGKELNTTATFIVGGLAQGESWCQPWGHGQEGGQCWLDHPAWLHGQGDKNSQ